MCSPYHDFTIYISAVEGTIEEDVLVTVADEHAFLTVSFVLQARADPSLKSDCVVLGQDWYCQCESLVAGMTVVLDNTSVVFPRNEPCGIELRIPIMCTSGSGLCRSPALLRYINN